MPISIDIYGSAKFTTLYRMLRSLFYSISLKLARLKAVRDNDNLKSHKYVYITIYQPDTKSNPGPNPNPNPNY